VAPHEHTSPTDAHHVPLSKADKLAQDADEAARVRSLANHPDVIALRVEKVRSQIDAVIWVGIFLGLAFTMVNVQQFAAGEAPKWSLGWLAAWLLDPMVSLVLIAVLRAEQITARYQVRDGMTWAHRTKWFAFLATYVMNTWQSWTDGHVAGIVLHSVPPVLVFLAAETAPVLRDKLTAAVIAAAGATFTGSRTATATEDAPAAETDAAANTPAVTVVSVDDRPTQPIPVIRDTDPAPARQDRAPRKTAAKKAPARKPSAKRKLLADYVAEARAALTPDTDTTPAWVREVTDCARGTSKNVADTLRAEQDARQEVTVTTVREAA
jgi:hypothetical protein